MAHPRQPVDGRISRNLGAIIPPEVRQRLSIRLRKSVAGFSATRNYCLNAIIGCCAGRISEILGTIPDGKKVPTCRRLLASLLVRVLECFDHIILLRVVASAYRDEKFFDELDEGSCAWWLSTGAPSI
jgi:hypothetical protein